MVPSRMTLVTVSKPVSILKLFRIVKEKLSACLISLVNEGARESIKESQAKESLALEGKGRQNSVGSLILCEPGVLSASPAFICKGLYIREKDLGAFAFPRPVYPSPLGAPHVSRQAKNRDGVVSLIFTTTVPSTHVQA